MCPQTLYNLHIHISVWKWGHRAGSRKEFLNISIPICSKQHKAKYSTCMDRERHCTPLTTSILRDPMKAAKAQVEIPALTDKLQSPLLRKLHRAWRSWGCFSPWCLRVSGDRPGHGFHCVWLRMIVLVLRCSVPGALRGVRSGLDKTSLHCNPLPTLLRILLNQVQC